MNKKLLLVIITVAVAAVIITATLLFRPFSKQDVTSNSAPTQNMPGATGDILSGEDLEKLKDTWSEYMESADIELEVIPNTSTPSSTTSTTTSSSDSSSKPSDSTGSVTSTPSSSTTSGTTSSVTSTQTSSDDGFLPGIW